MWGTVQRDYQKTEGEQICSWGDIAIKDEVGG